MHSIAIEESRAAVRSNGCGCCKMLEKKNIADIIVLLIEEQNALLIQM
jgi:hypothetical protein